MAVVVTVDPQSGYRVVVTVTGMTSPYVWTLERLDVDFGWLPVRGPGWIGDSVVTDYEAALNQTGGLYYRVTYYDLIGPNLIKFTVEGGSPAYLEAELPVISNPITGEYVELSVQSWPEWSRGERAATLEVPGADYPIIISDRLGAATSQVTLRTDTVETRRSLKDLLQVGHVYQLRPACSGVLDESGYLHMRQVTSRRRSNHAGDPVRFWPLDVTHASMPAPLIAAVGSTLQDIYDAYPTPDDLADLEAAFPGNLIDIAAEDWA